MTVHDLGFRCTILHLWHRIGPVRSINLLPFLVLLFTQDNVYFSVITLNRPVYFHLLKQIIAKRTMSSTVARVEITQRVAQDTWLGDVASPNIHSLFCLTR